MVMNRMAQVVWMMLLLVFCACVSVGGILAWRLSPAFAHCYFSSAVQKANSNSQVMGSIPAIKKKLFFINSLCTPFASFQLSSILYLCGSLFERTLKMMLHLALSRFADLREKTRFLDENSSES